MININYKYVKSIGGNKVCIFNSISDFQNSSSKTLLISNLLLLLL